MNNEGQNIEANEKKLKSRKSKIIIIILSILVLSLLGLCVYNNYQLKLEREKINNNDNTSLNEPKEDNDNLKQEEKKCECNCESNANNNSTSKDNGESYQNTINNVIGDEVNNIKYDYNYFENYDSKYIFLFSELIGSEKRWLDMGEDNKEADGGAVILLDSFSNSFKELYNEKFDSSKLNKDNGISKYELIHYPTIKNGLIYGGYVTGRIAPYNTLKYITSKYNEAANEVVYTYDLTHISNDEEHSEKNIGTVSLTLKVDDEKHVIGYKSLLIRK